jgi:hypothetical protein
VAEARVELLAKSLEELDVLGLLAGELQERPRPVVVAGRPRPRVIEDERENELLDEPEHDEIPEPRIWFRMRCSSVERKSSFRIPARDSGIKGFVKSRRLPPPMTSSILQPTLWVVASALSYVQVVHYPPPVFRLARC